MSKFALLTRLSPDALKSPASIKELADQVIEAVKRECPDVTWSDNYAVLGPYDYLDIFEARDERRAAKVAAIVRSFGHATTETWTLLPWESYEEMLEEAP